MAGSVIDRGGEVGADTIPAGETDGAVSRSGGWGNIAFLGAGVGLVGALGGIAIGYGAFHQPATTTTTVQPAKASQRSVDEVMNSPNAQRAALANQLGQPGAPATDVFGRPIGGSNGQIAVDTDGNPVATTPRTGAVPNGQQIPGQRRAEQARAMADAARRAPIMAFGSTGVGSGGDFAEDAVPQSRQSDPGQVDGSLSSVGRQRVGASGFEDAGDDTPTATTRGTSDFSDQLGHSAIQTVRATSVGDRNLLLSAGTVIPCTLQTAINSTQAGFVSCVINQDVYSENGRVVLLDKGTKVLGQYSGGITQGQARLFVVWTRALTPRGVAIDLGSPAADSLGRAGLPGGVDTQFWSRFGLGLVISVLEDASNIAGRAFAGNDSNTTQVPSTTGQTVLQQTMQIRPILKKNQGDTAAIFIAKDFDFRSVYEVGLRR